MQPHGRDKTSLPRDQGNLHMKLTHPQPQFLNPQTLNPELCDHLRPGCEDGLAYLCDLQTGSRSQMLRGHKEAVSAAAWRPGADFHLVTGGVDGTLRLWDVRRTRNCLALLSQVSPRRECFRFPKLKMQIIHALRSPRSRSKCCAQNPSNLHPEILNSQEGNPTVASRQVDMLSPPVAHSGGVDSLLYSHDGCNLLSSGADCRMRLWDPDTCELVVANYGTFPHR